jgi:hypothetical protein
LGLDLGPHVARQVLYHLSHASWPFGFVFQIRSHIYAHIDLDCDTPIYAFLIAEMTGTCHCAQLLQIEMGSHELFAQAGLEL